VRITCLPGCGTSAWSGTSLKPLAIRWRIASLAMPINDTLLPPTMLRSSGTVDLLKFWTICTTASDCCVASGAICRSNGNCGSPHFHAVYAEYEANVSIEHVK